jgi:hypothetical protein
MALDARKRQQKKEKRTRRRKDTLAARVRPAENPLALLARYPDAPFVNCQIHRYAFEEGMGNLLVGRQLPTGRVVAASFLVDMYCLGIKDSIFESFTRSEYARIVRQTYAEEPAVDLTPAEAKKLVLGAAEYARELGFQPAAEFADALALFDGIDATAADREFTFGKDGQPFYIAGPNDGHLFQSRVLATLDRSVGPGKYEVLLAETGFDDYDGMVGDPDRYELLGDDLFRGLTE